MTVTEEISQRLNTAFAPRLLEIENQSEQHRGHAGFQEGGESHFHVTISATALDGMSRLGRHRAVHSAIGKDLLGRIHALSLDVQVPQTE
ncbi:MAG: BolA family transcriptional regulator [Marinosulfonomonas sp.]|nr:BolA family transcriptional regulator [Marinosulfonomonas sp.]